ncbi:MAG: enoyl-CoA hydratase-related protein [Dehalococcoidia bacterium]|nr:enoyl-CoA hydratase-related protein [Dehalococcoidia bacterium]MDW8120026.1 enoyl-CoA hydratase-related protein [Chloroflexota bacterium]
MSQDILLTVSDGIATITFNRPTQRNAMNYQMWLDLQRLMVDLEHDPQVRVVVFTGAGDEAFSAGADIKDFDLYRNNADKARLYAHASEGAMDMIEALPKPTISLIKGYCIGGGCELATATDIRIGADNARLGITAARLGITIGFKEMRRLVDCVGPAGAKYILLTARLLDAQEALRLGLLHQVVPLAEVEAYTYRLAQEIANLGPLSHRYNKRILHKVITDPALRLTPEEEAMPFRVFDSQDYHEGRRAFLEKRKPQFQGK